VPAIISKMDDNTSAEVAIIENVQRKNLSAIEEAKSYQALLEKGYITQEELAKKMGLSQSAVANKLRLLSLDESVQQAVIEEKISERHARTLLQVKDKEMQKVLLNRIINERLTVKQLDDEIKKMGGNMDNAILGREKPVSEKKDIDSLDIPVQNTVQPNYEENSPYRPQNRFIFHNSAANNQSSNSELPVNSMNIERNFVQPNKFFRGNTPTPQEEVVEEVNPFVDVPEDIPIVNNPSYNNILSNSVDIGSPALIESNDTIDLENQARPVDIFAKPETMPNSFFNYLENEAVNMDVTEPSNYNYIMPTEEPVTNDINNTENIEMLDDFSIAVNSDQVSNDEYFNEVLNTIRSMNLDTNRVTIEEMNLPQEYKINITIKKNTDVQ
jgi:transcriptional regulator with XRE-family HTH domain